MLEAGDAIMIKYRFWRGPAGQETLVDAWIGAQIVCCEAGAWPLARLSDGQMTEVRPYMAWRLVAKAAVERLAA